MKRNTTPTLTVSFAVENSNVKSIDFVFKQEDSEDATAIVEKNYPENVTYENGVYYVPFSVEETLKFEESQYFFMDTRLETMGGKIPETPIVRLFMSKTLFKSEVASE